MAEQFCVMTMAKRHRADVRALQQEANREHDDPERYKNNVDLAKSGDNYYFVKSSNWNESISEVLESNDIKESPNSVVLITSVYAVSSSWLDEHTEDEAMEYFKTCFEYEQKTKGIVINAVVHKDEGSWHMQVATVPVVEVQSQTCEPKILTDEDGNEILDEYGKPKVATYERGKSKGQVIYKRKPLFDENGNPVTHKGLSAKAVVGNRVAMSKRQTDFWEKCGKQFGMSRGEIRIENTEDAKEHLSEIKYKASKIIEDAEKKAEEVKKDADDLAEREAKVKAREDAVTLLEAQIATKKQEAEILLSNAKESLKTQNMDLQKRIQDVDSAKMIYKNAYDSAEGIAKGFAVNSFYNAFHNALQVEMSRVRYKDGSTGWDRWHEYVDKAFERSKQRENVSNLTVENQYKERVANAVERADMKMQSAKRNLPNIDNIEQVQNDNEGLLI